MRSRARRFATFLAIVGIFAGVAAFAAYLVASRMVIREARHLLLADSVRAIRLADAQAKEVRETLTVINGLANIPCSEGDMASLHKLIFLSRYLKDAGRIQGGKFLCSSVLPKSALPQEEVSPSSVGNDGLRTYRMAQWQIHGRQTLIFQLGTAFVDVFLDSHGELSQRSLPDEEYITTLRLERFQYLAPGIRAAAPQRAKLYTIPGEYAEGGRVLATTCSSVLAHCVTESIRTSDLLRHNKGRLTEYTALGGIIGALLGWVVSLRFGRDNTVAGRLKRAIRRREIRVAFQPIVDLSDSRVVGAEVLARWTDDDRVPISPDIFIRIAEEHGQMEMLTKRIVQRAHP